MAFEALVFEQRLSVPVRSLALGHAPKIAVLADAPYLFDGERFVRRELPEPLRPAPEDTDHVAIFFGRDDQPRIMGTRVGTDGAPRPVYLRHLTSGWRREPSELGPLASARAGLYGHLGHEDPEIVCAPAVLCLVKRVTGWSRIDADPAPATLLWTARGVYKATGNALLRLEGGRWEVAAADFSLIPDSLCHRAEDELWFTAAGALHVRKGDASPSTVLAPIEVPRAVHCAADASIWVVGDGGAAHFDGSRWSTVPGDLGRLDIVAGHGADDIWLAGEHGAFRGLPPMG